MESLESSERSTRLGIVFRIQKLGSESRRPESFEKTRDNESQTESLKSIDTDVVEDGRSGYEAYILERICNRFY